MTAVTDGFYDKDQTNSYVEAKEAAFRERIELYTTLQLVGILEGKRVIDVACGSGWLTRELWRRNGASYVLGTDKSPEMIQLASREMTQKEALSPPIQFEVEDARDARPAEFDVVTSNWLLVNARNRTELGQMCRGLACKAKSGAKLVTMVTSPDLFTYPDPGEWNRKLKPYGFAATLPSRLGEPLTFHLFAPSGDPIMEIVNYYHSKEAYQEELEAAGFENIRFVADLLLSPEADDEADWKVFLSVPTVVAIVATKK